MRVIFRPAWGGAPLPGSGLASRGAASRMQSDDLSRGTAIQGRSGEQVVIVEYGSAPKGHRGLGGGEVRKVAGEADVGPSAADRRDAEVRRHEAAHMAALGGLAGSAVLYDEARAGDGGAYASGARIKVDLAEVPGNPRETLRRARQIQRAAMAPGSPSPADSRVAAEARRLARSAQREIAVEFNAPAGTELGIRAYSSQNTRSSEPGALQNHLV